MVCGQELWYFRFDSSWLVKDLAVLSLKNTLKVSIILPTYNAGDALLLAVEWVWAEVDMVWNSYNLNNRKLLENQAIGDFYSHAVWLMNGVFTSLVSVSEGHRELISQFFIEE